MEFQEFKEKILTFNKTFQVVPEAQISELSKEISAIMGKNLVCLKQEAKKSSLYLWNLFLEINGEE